MDVRIPKRALSAEVRRLPSGSLRVQGKPPAQAWELDGLAEAIWRSSDGRRTVGEIARQIAGEHAADEAEVHEDVVDFLEDLAQEGLIVWLADGR